MVKIKDVDSRLIKNLSKGYRQRVGLAQAVLGFPEIIILDEPSVGLDPKQIIEIRELIRKLAKKHTVILSSHILAEVREVCDYILIISKGKLVASDTPENLERLLGDAGMIEIETEAPAVRVREILKNVPGIESVSAKTGADGITYGQIQERKDADIRATIFNAFAENQTPLLKLNAAQSSLEDVFMELTQNEKAADDYAKKAHRSLVKKEQFKDADALKFEETEKILDEEEIKNEVHFEETEISSGELQFEDEEAVAKEVQFQDIDIAGVTGEEDEEHAGDL